MLRLDSLCFDNTEIIVPLINCRLQILETYLKSSWFIRALDFSVINTYCLENN